MVTDFVDPEALRTLRERVLPAPSRDGIWIDELQLHVKHKALADEQLHWAKRTGRGAQFSETLSSSSP